MTSNFNSPPFPSRSWERTILQWWWVFAFFLLCFAAYERSISYTQKKISHLQTKCEWLLQERKDCQKEVSDLMRQIYSQSDPLYIELMIMQHLGKCPQGSQKVIFRIPPSEESL